MSLPRFYGKSLERNLRNNMKKEKALENAKKLVSMFPEYKETLETLVPELRKNDEGKVREEIIEYLKLVGKGDGDYAQPIVDRWIAWLQSVPVSECDNNPSNNERVIIPKFRPGDEIKLIGSNLKLKIGHVENGHYYAENKSWCIGIEAADSNYELVNAANLESALLKKAVKYLNDTFYFQDNSSGRGEDHEITTHDFDSMEDFIDSFCNYIKTGER